MYLETYVGNYVTFNLIDSAKHEKTLNVFYDTEKNDDLIRNKLIAVDQLGIWVEGFKNTTIFYDDNMTKLEKPIEKYITFHVLIRWEYLGGIFVVENPEFNEKKIGFN